MNKYLKILMLSGGLIGAVAPCAINWDKTPKYDLGYIYNHVEKMQKAVPKLSRIDYKLNIGLDNFTNDDLSTLDEVENNDIVDKESDYTHNITFSATDEQGNPTQLDNIQTINYLNETLNQTNIEYENLKETLITAINDTMNYLEDYKDNPQRLTNEQKIYIKEHSNSIKYLAETLEDLSEEVICSIDCKDCEDCDDINETAGIYINTIQNLENRIQTLQNTINSLHFITSIGSRLYNTPTFTPQYALYHITKDIKDEDRVEFNKDSDNADNSNNTDSSNDTLTEDNTVNINDNNNENNTPTTFNLKSNIDTYAPKKRNIDTFFNTALLDDQYNMYGGGFGYGVPYNGYGMYGGGFGNPYNGYNSNMINRDAINHQTNQANNAPVANTSANIDNSTAATEKIDKPEKIHAKKTKNIDTYTLSTIQSNINTMSESKISKFIKNKFGSLRKKVKNKTDDIKNNQQENQNGIDDTANNEAKNTNAINNALEQTNNDIADRETSTTVDLPYLNINEFGLPNDIYEDLSDQAANTPDMPHFQPDIKTK